MGQAACIDDHRSRWADREVRLFTNIVLLAVGHTDLERNAFAECDEEVIAGHAHSITRN